MNIQIKTGSSVVGKPVDPSSKLDDKRRRREESARIMGRLPNLETEEEKTPIIVELAAQINNDDIPGSPAFRSISDYFNVNQRRAWTSLSVYTTGDLSQFLQDKKPNFVKQINQLGEKSLATAILALRTLGLKYHKDHDIFFENFVSDSEEGKAWYLSQKERIASGHFFFAKGGGKAENFAEFNEERDDVLTAEAEKLVSAFFRSGIPFNHMQACKMCGMKVLFVEEAQEKIHKAIKRLKEKGRYDEIVEKSGIDGSTAFNQGIVASISILNSKKTLDVEVQLTADQIKRISTGKTNKVRVQVDISDAKSIAMGSRNLLEYGVNPAKKKAEAEAKESAIPSNPDEAKQELYAIVERLIRAARLTPEEKMELSKRFIQAA